jgi:hypothetical protein
LKRFYNYEKRWNAFISSSDNKFPVSNSNNKWPPDFSVIFLFKIKFVRMNILGIFGLILFIERYRLRFWSWIWSSVSYFREIFIYECWFPANLHWHSIFHTPNNEKFPLNSTEGMECKRTKTDFTLSHWGMEIEISLQIFRNPSKKLVDFNCKEEIQSSVLRILSAKNTC